MKCLSLCVGACVCLFVVLSITLYLYFIFADVEEEDLEDRLNGLDMGMLHFISLSQSYLKCMVCMPVVLNTHLCWVYGDKTMRPIDTQLVM